MLWRGIIFVGDIPVFFSSLSELMDVSVYDWYVDDIELNYFDFRSGKFSGAEFNNALNDFSRLSFVRLRRYPIDSVIKQIDTYDDFLESECDFLVLLYDGGLFEIYSKEENLIYKICEWCSVKCFDHIKYVDNDNDQRSYMHF